ncbi:MAG TPA: rod-binding protein [Stenomitos sp.]
MEINGLPQPPRLPTSWPTIQSEIEGTLPSAPREVQQGGIREAAESFASYLYAQVFSEMRSQDSDEEGLFSGETSGMFMDFFDQALGKQYATSNGNTLVEQLVKQLSKSKGEPDKVE